MWFNLYPFSHLFPFMDCKGFDESLIRRGELLLSLDLVDGYDRELEALNDGKPGRPFRLTTSYTEFVVVRRYLFSTLYRQVEGFTRA